MKRLYKNIGVMLTILVLSACSKEVLTENGSLIPTNPNPEGDALPPNEEWAWVGAYPGEVNNSFQRLSNVEVTVKYSSPLNLGLKGTPQNWQSTGLYVPPAELVTITVPEGIENLKYQIGIANIDINDNIMLKRSRAVTKSGDLKGGINNLSSNFGGHLYIYFKDEPPTHEIKIKISGAVKSCDYILDETNIQEWKDAVSDTVNSMIWGELIGKRIILTLPTSTLRMIDNPKVLLDFYDEIFTKDFDAIVGTNTAELTIPWRFYSDVQLPVETGTTPYKTYGDYPLGFNSTTLDGKLPKVVATLDKIESIENSLIILEGLAGLYQTNWGSSKLLGPQVQKMYAYHFYQRKNQWNQLGITMPNKPMALSTRYWMSTAADRMTMVLQLAQQYGWGLFTYCSQQCRQQIKGNIPDQYKNDLFAIYSSEYANTDLTLFFESWDFPVSSFGKNYMKKYPAATDEFWNITTPSKQPSLTATLNPGTSYPKEIPVKDTVYDRKKWIPKAVSQSGSVIANIIDGNISTTWESQWSGSGVGKNQYPHWVSFMFEEETTFNYLYFVQRDHQNLGPKTFIVFTKPTPDPNVDDWVEADNGKKYYLCRDRKNYQYRYLNQEYTAYGVKIQFNEGLPSAGSGNVASGSCSVAEFGTGLLK